MRKPPRRSPPGRQRILARVLFIGVISCPLQADELDPVNPAEGVRTWRWAGDGVSLRLTQILPDQVRGFYQARGFTAADAESIAQVCVFQTVMRNESVPGLVEIDLKHWWIALDGGKVGLKIEKQWQTEWERRRVSPPARLAFRWALFPTVQAFAAGDWNMGMTTFALPPSTVFDLHFNWRVGAQEYESVVRGVACPAEATGDAS